MSDSQQGFVPRLILDGPPEPGVWLVRSILLGILLISLGMGIWQASAKPFWFDEILTIQVSSLPTAEARWQALYEGCDGMPPGYYWITALAARLPLDDHVRWRVPELIGWLLALLGVYLFASSANGRVAGLAAALLLALTPAASYAWEARPYALLVGVLALAAVCWQRVSRHWAWCMLLAALLAAATSLHYLAPLSVVCFALAEVIASAMHRRWRWGGWVAFAAASIPAFAALPLLLKMRADFGAQFWSRPQLGGLPYYYGKLIGFPLEFALVLLPFGFMYLLRDIVRKRRTGHEWEALLLSFCLLLLPVVGLLCTLLTHGGFNERYVMPVTIAYATAIPLLLNWRPGGAARGFTACLLLAFLVLTGRNAVELRTVPPARIAGSLSPALSALRANASEPLVVSNPLEYLAGWQYGSGAERERLYFIGDLEGASRLSTTDGAMRLLLALHQIVPIRVRTIDGFLQDRQEFLLFAFGPQPLNWQVTRLKELQCRLEPLRETAGGQLYRVRAP